MTALGVQRRRGRTRPEGRRRSGGHDRPSAEGMPRLFPEEGDRSSPAGAEERVAQPPQARAPMSVSPTGGRDEGMTLEELVCGVWEDVVGDGRAVCPLCGGEMRGRASAHARPSEGHCGDCGTTIG